MTTRNRHIQSIERAMSLLEQLKTFPDGASLADLCEPHGLSKSTAHGLLDTLSDLGYVSHQGTRYRVGARIQALALANNDSSDRVRELFSPALQAFNELCEADCFLAVPSGTRSYLTLDAIDACGRALTPCNDSKRDALRTSAIGKVFLAHDPALARRTRRTAPLDRVLEDELIQVSHCGFALDNQASQADLNCMAIPLRLKGQVIAALGTSGAPHHLPTRLMELIAKRALRQLYDVVKY